ncbi:histidine/lysine/arginine/ornithine transporter subunit; membrane component of ABC superfamily [Paraburkholderia piptadeniae]|uniref:ABC transporter permease subunit n=2 Tax=Paraburkholderia TaxID=1822464 RepID=A0A7X1NEC3_9BURK|nr:MULTISPECIES: ABC transporter permease subunit [Paraburkholderia]MPW20409.1 ABC transporter permease subunit [Paraburkholderia franconis]SIT50959.1 histidine/lysine/arginine/ornithine transporter subunit; membrane component of ABC superfamily [Paraburkholderia piptadeniae]
MDIFQGYLDLVSDYGTRLAFATLVSIELLAISAVFGFLIAIPVGVGRTSRYKPFYWASSTYSSVFRGTPLLVQLFVIYYGIAQFESLRSSFAWPFFSNAFCCAALALTLNLGAYMAEHIRAGIISIPEGETEAALAFGFGKLRMLAGIIVPRALRVATPALTNEVIVQLKATALASTITVLDLTGLARRLSAQSYTLDPFIFAAVIYASLTLVIATVSRMLESRGNRYLALSPKRA